METLYTLAEIAIGMAGFSAIVVVFKRRDAGIWRATDADRFNGMIVHSIAAVFFCVLPAVIAPFSGEESRVWRIGSSVLGIQVLAHVAGVLRLSTTPPLGQAFVGTSGAAVALLQALNVLGILFAGAFGPYLLGVVWHLVLAGALFVMLVWVDRESIDGP